MVAQLTPKRAETPARLRTSAETTGWLRAPPRSTGPSGAPLRISQPPSGSLEEFQAARLCPYARARLPRGLGHVDGSASR